MTSSIPRDQWYVAAFGHEIGTELFARTVCGEPILCWRTASGTVTAVSDRCAHRRFPLSQPPSRLADDHVVCGYHGYTYAADGRCVAVPGQTLVPRTARLKSYPVVEQDSFVWVWIGDPGGHDPDHDHERAVPARIPRAPQLASPDYTTVSGLEPLAARYSLLVDNLLDLSHETYLHGGYIGTPDVASTPITTEVDQQAGVVRVSRRMHSAECPPFYSQSTGLTGRITRWQDIEFSPPCLYRLHSRISPVGVLPRPDGTDPDAFHVEVVYAITPEAEHSTHDFWAVARDFALDDPKVSDFLAEQNRAVVRQDVAALNMLEQVTAAEAGQFREVSGSIDAGALAARRMLRRLVEPPAAAAPR